MLRKLTGQSVLVLVLVFACAGPALATPGDTLRVVGLTQPVEVIRDRFGVNHIYAQNEHDLFFAQGYSAAKDRLFQFEIWRRQATGTTAEILGKRELKRDIGTRLHMFRGDMKQEMLHYHPHGDVIITAFVEGTNAYIDEANRNPSGLPLEFKLLGIKPGRWTPEVVISRHQALLANIEQEVAMGQAVHQLGAEKVKALFYFQPANPNIDLDPAIDGSLLGPQVLDLYSAFRAPLRFASTDIVTAYRGNDAAYDRLAQAVPQVNGEVLSMRREDIGSNNWVVSGKLTQSGFPLLANDPHRAFSAPSLRYDVHLIAPGWNVIGGGEPELPGISIGHNEYGAWGLTVYGNDSEDLYVYETNPSNPNQYKYKGAWEDMTVIRDRINVKGESPVSVDLKYTRHGPVLSEDKAHNKAYALRAGWREIGNSPYLASLRMNQAKTWEEFREACKYSALPSENMVWADRAGNIGWQAVGIQPIRPNFSGLVPVPGDGRYEWSGYLPMLELPHVYNPEKGWFATANGYLAPLDYRKDAVHFTWADPFRTSRIDEFLGSGRKHALIDMMQLQQDEFSIPARSLVPLLADVKTDDPAVRDALAKLRDWNFVLDKNSIPAGIYVAWERRLSTNVRDLMVPVPSRTVIGFINMKRIIDLLASPPAEFGSNPLAGRDAVLVRSMKEALGDLTEKLGPDPARWQYGQEKYKHSTIMHLLSGAVKPEVRAQLDVGALPRGGNGYTVNNTGGADNQLSGPSFRVAIDTENWDTAVGTNAPGQSGDPDSPHYRDLYPIWATGKYFPLYYSRGKVESAAETKQLWVPGARSAGAGGSR